MAIVGIPVESFIEVRKEKTVQQAKRIKLLGLCKGAETVIRRYNFPLPVEIDLKNDDEEKVKRVLEQIAQQRYAGKSEQYKIWDTDRETRNFMGTWDWLELRYPRHYAGYVDSISVSRGWQGREKYEPTRVGVWFVRGRREISSSTRRRLLDEQAQQIYEQIRAGLVR